MELVDENTIKLGINGSTTLEVTRDMLDSWPFTKASTGTSVGAKGLYLVMRMDLLNDNYKREANELVNRDYKVSIPGKFYQFY